MRESPLTGHVEGVGADLTEASFVVIDVPKRLFGRVAAYLESRATMRRKIVELKDRNLILSARAQRMEALMAENMRYKALLNSAVAEDTTMTVARIVAVSPDVNRHLLTLNRGDADGVMIGDPVLNADGVMGQVTQVGRSAYRRPDGIMGICVGHTSGAYGRSLWDPRSVRIRGTAATTPPSP